MVFLKTSICIVSLSLRLRTSHHVISVQFYVYYRSGPDNKHAK